MKASTRLRQFTRAAGGALHTILYPPHCEHCDARTEENEVLCDDCLRSNRAIEPPFCETCGEPFHGALSGRFECANCGDRSFSFEFAIGAWRNRGAVRSLLHKFKYGKRDYLAKPLAHLLLPVLDDERLYDNNENWTIVPVPLHHRRRRERGFNQAAEIGRHFATHAGFEFADLLQRTFYTTSQAQLSRAQRLQNLRHAFRVKKSSAEEKSLADRQVLLIDDVFTTGATADACARILRREAGVERVVVLTLLRG
ncbi:MAG: ComF family protein [Verrucomicrobiota bacterium]